MLWCQMTTNKVKDFNYCCGVPIIRFVVNIWEFRWKKSVMKFDAFVFASTNSKQTSLFLWFTGIWDFYQIIYIWRCDVCFFFVFIFKYPSNNKQKNLWPQKTLHLLLRKRKMTRNMISYKDQMVAEIQDDVLCLCQSIHQSKRRRRRRSNVISNQSMLFKELINSFLVFKEFPKKKTFPIDFNRKYNSNTS